MPAPAVDASKRRRKPSKDADRTSWPSDGHATAETMAVQIILALDVILGWYLTLKDTYLNFEELSKLAIAVYFRSRSGNW